MKCPNCNTENPAGEEFCTGCGSALPTTATSGDQNNSNLALPPADNQGPVIITLNLGGTDYQMREGGKLRFLRKDSSKKQDGDIEIDDDTVSGSPITVSVEGGKVKVSDGGSSSGFQVTKTVRPNEDIEIEPGEMIMPGNVVITTS